MQQFPALRPYFEKSRTEAMLIGKTEGMLIGMAEGKAEGKAEGQVDGEATALLRYFAAAGDELSSHAQLEIVSCADPGTLLDWLDRAYRGETSAEIFDSAPALPVS
jgi:hypothetical protein